MFIEGWAEIVYVNESIPRGKNLVVVRYIIPGMDYDHQFEEELSSGIM